MTNLTGMIIDGTKWYWCAKSHQNRTKVELVDTTTVSDTKV
jgi:hypothetical protein